MPSASSSRMASSTAFDDKGSEYRVAGKQAVIMSMARSHGMINNGGRGLSSSIHIRRNALKELVPNLDDAPVALVPESTRGLALLRSYAMLIVNDPLSTSDIRHAADEHLVHLFAIVAGATGDALDFAVANGVAAGRLRAIKADILQQLADPSLNLEIVAARHGITTRHVQRLFEREGTSFSGFLGEARLSCAHGKLTNRNYAGVSILSIAFECGFADISTFNRAFRRAYGMTPSEARNMGR